MNVPRASDPAGPSASPEATAWYPGFAGFLTVVRSQVWPSAEYQASTRSFAAP